MSENPHSPTKLRLFGGYEPNPEYVAFNHGYGAGVMDTQEKAHEEGYRKCKGELVPLMKGVLDVLEDYGLVANVEHLITNEQMALLKRAKGQED